MSRRRISWLAVPVLVALLAAGCARGDDLAPDAAVQGGEQPVVGLTQAAGVLDAVDTALAGARGVRSASAVGDRVIGPYRDIALTQARVDHARKRTSAAPGDFTLVKLMVPRAAAWPRFFVAVGDVKGESTPSLRVLSSSDARSPYGLWAQASMLPGATLPQVAAPTTGAAVLPADAASGLLMSPQRAAAGIAGYLNAGGHDSAHLFRRSSFSDQVVQQLVSDRKALKSAATVSSRHSVTRVAPLAIRTADGGALVIAQLRQDYTLKTSGGRSVALTDRDLAALGRREEAVLQIVHTYIGGGRRARRAPGRRRAGHGGRSPEGRRAGHRQMTRAVRQ